MQNAQITPGVEALSTLNRQLVETLLHAISLYNDRIGEYVPVRLRIAPDGDRSKIQIALFDYERKSTIIFDISPSYVVTKPARPSTETLAERYNIKYLRESLSRLRQKISQSQGEDIPPTRLLQTEARLQTLLWDALQSNFGTVSLSPEGNYLPEVDREFDEGDLPDE
ncbi:MAG: hypothetical protein QUS07_07180 [Methanothrix sp.]|nr:hypothetical protein [Methanothrix sp.]